MTPISPTPEGVRPAAPSLEQEELRGISRTVAEIHWLLLILVLVYVIYGDADKESEAAVISATFFYAAFVMSFRYANFYKRESRWKVALESWAMIGFITWVCYFTGGLASPLLNTYLLPETPPKGALEVAGRIRDAVANVPLELDGKRVACTVSIGIAGHPADGNTLDAVVARADRAMYQAKRQGRNCVVQFDLGSLT